VEAGRMELKPVEQDIARLAADLVSAHRAHAQAKGLAIELTLADGLPASVMIDAQRVRQILNNLLNNAIKFTENGRIDLRVSIEGARIALAVSDTGPGISPEGLGVIFERFRQLDRFITRDHGGTGLGLTLARELAHLLEGDLVVESRLGEGSTFTLFIPLREPHS